MTQIKKLGFGAAVTALFAVMAMATLVNTAYAATVTTRADATIGLATNNTTGSGVATPVSLVLTLAASELDAHNETLTLTLPANWAFVGDQTVSIGATPATALTLVSNVGAVVGQVATWTVDTNGNNAQAVLTFSLNVRPASNAAATGNIGLAGTGVGVNANVGTLTVPAGGSVSVTVADAQITPDGTQVTTVSAWVFDGATPQSNKAVTFTASIGGFGAAGNTTFQTFTGTGTPPTSPTVPSATAQYRGTGTAGTDNIIVQTPAPAPGVGTATVTLQAAPGQNATALTVVSTSNNGRVGQGVTTATPPYVAPTGSANVVFRTANASNQPVNNQVLQVTTDKGALVAGASQSCTGVTARAVTVQTAGDGTTAGRATVTFCGVAGAANAGTATITANNVTTTMPAVTAEVTTAGVPAKIATNWANGVLTVTVTDANDVPVANGTSVRVTLPQNVGAVSPDAETGTVNGQAQFAVALTQATGNAIVTVRDAVGSANIRVNQSVNVTQSTPAPGSGDGSLTAPNFGAGNVGSAVFDGGSIEELADAAADAGGTAVWVQGTNGNWYRYSIGATGATAFVNNAFNTQFAAGFAGATPVFVVK